MARSPETPTTRQTFIWMAMSTRIETRIAKAKAALSSTVKLVVWVMKPGPMAEVAMRNIAPSRALRLLARGIWVRGSVAVASSIGSPVRVR